jgi:hypothetical protein
MRHEKSGHLTLMMSSAKRTAAVLGVLACVMVTAVWFMQPVRFVRTQDRNHDGRPDVWRYFDARGRLVEVVTDTNFDGRPDQEDDYRNNALILRETDRNFDDQIDEVEEFDAETSQPIRSIVDVDFDGTADLLTLFQDGQPVFSKWNATSVARPSFAAPVAVGLAEQLRPLVDPFAYETTLRASSSRNEGTPTILLLPTVARPADTLNAVDELTPSRLPASRATHPQTDRISFRTPRGPPLRFVL